MFDNLTGMLVGSSAWPSCQMHCVIGRLISERDLYYSLTSLT
jgi:hypothetical protein